MEFYPIRPPQNLPPLIKGLEDLVEGLEKGEPVVLDEEEERAADKEVGYMCRTFFKDKEFPKEDAETLWKGFAADGLRKVAKLRLYEGDLKSAASTCAKLLPLLPTLPTFDKDWLLLAEILAEQGDTTRSKTFLDKAKKIHKGYGQTEYSEAAWKNIFQKVQDIVTSKQRK